MISRSEKIDYWQIFRLAFKITWSNKSFWIFGFFIFCFFILFGLITFELIKSIPFLHHETTSLILSDSSKISAIEIFCVAIIALLFTALRVVGISAIIKCIYNVPVYSQSKLIKIISEVKIYTKKLLLADIVIFASSIILFLTLFIPVAYLFMLDAKILAMPLVIIAIVLYLFLLFEAFFLRKYIQMYLVLGNMRLLEAIEAAIGLIYRKGKESFTMLIISATMHIAAVVLFFALVIMALIILSPLFFVSLFISYELGIVAILALFGIITFVFATFFYSWFFLFNQASWVIFFEEITLQKKKKDVKKESLGMDVLPSPEPA